MNPFECVEGDGVDREISDEQDASDVKNDSEDDYNVYTDENIEEPEVYNDVNGPKEKDGLPVILSLIILESIFKKRQIF